jgi:hypothetical protein
LFTKEEFIMIINKVEHKLRLLKKPLNYAKCHAELDSASQKSDAL